ncbi:MULTISPECIES: competence protein ComS [unclassified Bacillus (in: firmicutes)]|uniref:competence protein ComS n=1 Tax=unclassified Bacillus (in: firmicutes) TaxID=185979 RepID=UPI002554BA4D|nr:MULTISPECIES: competence protein ComS [unclassified Bacillus (in: firmicutes)]
MRARRSSSLNRSDKRLIRSIILYPQHSAGCISLTSSGRQARATTSLLYFCWKEQ